MIDKFYGDYRWLSNFWDAPIKIGDMTCKTVEHGYQAAKCAKQADVDAILAADTPAAAKKLGQNVKIRKDWDNIKVKYMYTLVRQKFKQHKDLAQKLLDTNGEVLTEGNYWGDTFWGVCKGVGENWLGRILMKVREELMLQGIDKFCEKTDV